MIPKVIDLTPYQVMSGIIEQEATLHLTNSIFDGVTYQQGKVIFQFSHCRFNKLTIINSATIDFKNIFVGFYSCAIDDFLFQELVSPNVHIGFFGSMIDKANINQERLCEVNINNCLINLLYIKQVQRVDISFTRENYEPERWKDLCAALHIQWSDHLTHMDKCFILDQVKTVRCSSNYTEEESGFSLLRLELRYGATGTDLNTTVSGMFLKSLSISGSPSGTVSIENTKVNTWYIHEFSPAGKKTSFWNIGPLNHERESPKIGIHLSKLDNVDFDNISFDGYQLISFYRTKFSKANFTACDFPDSYETFAKFVAINNVHYPDEKEKNHDKAQYEIFLQLKKAMDDLGNFHESYKFQALAHEALRKMKGVSRADRNILHINSWSNGHGLSILNPFVGFLLFSVPWYLFYLLSIGRLFQPTEIDWNLIGYYFSFVDITHRTDFLAEKEELNGWSLALDYLGKLGIGFLIYQFIAAFRKYGKR